MEISITKFKKKHEQNQMLKQHICRHQNTSAHLLLIQFVNEKLSEVK